MNARISDKCSLKLTPDGDHEQVVPLREPCRRTRLPRESRSSEYDLQRKVGDPKGGRGGGGNGSEIREVEIISEPREWRRRELLKVEVVEAM